jgi:hypothetical protein
LLNGKCITIGLKGTADWFQHAIDQVHAVPEFDYRMDMLKNNGSFVTVHGAENSAWQAANQGIPANTEGFSPIS